MSDWRNIDTAPKQGSFEVCGDSGYSAPNDRFIAIVFRDPEHRGGRFLLPGSDDLRDMGWTPTHWRPRQPLPLGDHPQIPTIHDGIIVKINGQRIWWTDNKSITHSVIGADVHLGVRLLWTRCSIDVPADTAFAGQLSKFRQRCVLCAARGGFL